jgi:protein associated with RNAse G/E
MEAIVVQYYKNPDILHWGFAGYLIGTDDHGSWVGLPRGTDRWKGAAQQTRTAEDAVLCLPHRGWWTLHYAGMPGPVTHFVDITTQPRRTENGFEMIDLDLDLLVMAEGQVVIEDEDEFQVHQLMYGYSPEMIEKARAETERVAHLLRGRREPFFDVASSWLTFLRSTI